MLKLLVTCVLALTLAGSVATAAGVPAARDVRGGVVAGVPAARGVRDGVVAGVPAARDVRGGVVAQPAEPPPAPFGRAQGSPERSRGAQAEAHQPADEHGTADAAHGEQAHGTLWTAIGPYVNFLVLCGLLYYVLRKPVAEYLQGRRSGIRKDLVEAAELRSTATAHLAEIDRKVKALPGEIETLRRRGTEEIAAEEARIAKQAASERERLLEQARREIDVQLRVAKRELLEHAADLSVQLASDRIKQQITPSDQDRLVDRYLGQLGSDEASH